MLYATRISDQQIVTFYNQAYADWFIEGTACDFQAAQFTYENASTDVESPEVNWPALNVEPSIVGGSQTVAITVPMSDASPIPDAYITFAGEDKWSLLNAPLTYNEQTGLYEAFITIDPFATSQAYSVEQLVASDAYGNTTTLTDIDAPDILEGDRVELDHGNFQVNNPNADVTPPQADLTTLHVSLDADQRPVLHVKVSDEQSGVQYVEAVYQTLIGPLQASGTVENGEASLMLPIDSYMRSQTLTLENLIVIDNQNSRSDYERSDGLANGDYTYTESPTLLVVSLDDLFYFDQNQNGQFDETEKPTRLITPGVYLSPVANPDERYYFVNEGSVGEDNYTVEYTGNALLADVPSGTYQLNLDPSNAAHQTITPGIITISGDFGQQSVKVEQRLGIYQAGTMLEVAHANIFNDRNSNGTQEEDEPLIAPIIASEKAVGIATYENLYLVASTGEQYGFAAYGKGAGGENAYVYGEDGIPALLPAGTYTIVTTQADSQITTPSEITLDERNAHLLTLVIERIGIGPKIVTPTNQAPVLSGMSDQTITLGTAFDPKAGVSATDPEDGTIDFTISGQVDSNKIGTYTLTYTAMDSQGLTTTKTRTVSVIAKATPTIPVVTPPVVTPSKVVATTGTPTTLANTGDQTIAMTILIGVVSTVAGVTSFRRRK